MRSALVFGLWLLSFAMPAGAQDLPRLWTAVGRLDLRGQGFCTGTLIAPRLVLTAAHCLFDHVTGQPIAAEDIEFLANWRAGRAEFVRRVRRAAHHSGFAMSDQVEPETMRFDLALLELERPITGLSIPVLAVAPMPAAGRPVTVVAQDSGAAAQGPPRGQICQVVGHQAGVLISSCAVDFGASGAPVFHVVDGQADLVSVVSAKAEIDGRPVTMGSALGAPLRELQEQMKHRSGPGASFPHPAPGAKFIRAGE